MAFNKLILALLVLLVGASAWTIGLVNVDFTGEHTYTPSCIPPAWNTTYGRYNFADYVDNQRTGNYYFNASTAVPAAYSTLLGLDGYTVMHDVHAEDASGNRTLGIFAQSNSDGALYRAVFQVSTQDRNYNQVYTVPDLYLQSSQPSDAAQTLRYCNGFECVLVGQNATDVAMNKMMYSHYEPAGGGLGGYFWVISLTNTTVAGTAGNNNAPYVQMTGGTQSTGIPRAWVQGSSLGWPTPGFYFGWSTTANATQWYHAMPDGPEDFRFNHYGCSSSEYNATFQTVEGNPVCPNGPIVSTCSVSQSGVNVSACTSSYTSSALSFSSNRPNIPEGLEGDAAIPKQFFKFRNWHVTSRSYLTTTDKTNIGFTGNGDNVVYYEYPDDTASSLKIKLAGYPVIDGGFYQTTVGRLRFTSDVSISGMNTDNVTLDFTLDAKPWCNYTSFFVLSNNFDAQVMAVVGYNNTAYKEVSAYCNNGVATNLATSTVYDLNDFYGNLTNGDAQRIVASYPYETTPVTIDQVNGNVEQFVLFYVNVSDYDGVQPANCDAGKLGSSFDDFKVRTWNYAEGALESNSFCVTEGMREQAIYIRDYNVTYQANLSSVAQCTAPGLANGAYNYLCTTPSGYNSTAASGTLTISNSDTVIPVYYQKGVSDDYFVAIRLKQYSGAPVVGATCQSDKWGYVFSDIHGLCNFTTASPATTTTIKVTGVQGEQLLSFGLTSGDQYGLCFDGSSYAYCPTANRTTEVCDSFSGGYTYDYKVYPGGLKPMNFFVGSGTVADFKDHPVNGAELSIDAGNYSCTTSTTGFCQAPMTYDFIAHTAVVYHPDYTNTSAIFYDSIDDTVYINAVLKGEEQRKKEEPKVVDYTGLITLAMSGDGVGLGGSLILGIVAVVLTGGSVVFGGIAFTAGIVFFTIAGLLNPIWAFLVALIAALGTAAMVAGLFAKGG